MRHSETINELAEALAKAQGKIEAAIRGKENTFYKSSYADLSAVMAACRQPLSENGLAVVQATEYEGPEFWITTMLVHKSGQWFTSRYPIRPVKNDPQGLGSAQTYARRYALMAMVGIVADDDDDGNAASAKGNGKIANGVIGEDQVRHLRDMIDRAKADPEKFCEYMKVDAITEIHAKDYERAVMALNMKERQVQK